MSQANPSATLDVVHKEIETTLQSVEQSLGRFLDDRDSGEDLQTCIDYLNQLRGIFVIVDFKGAIALCNESVLLANEIPVGASEDKNDILAKLSDGVFALKRYAEYITAEKADFPELLLDILNQLRMCRKQSILLESHFHSIDEQRVLDLNASVDLEAFAPLSDFEHHAHRFRQLYQTGLLSILRDGDKTIGLRLISRGLEGATRLSIGYAMAPFWALAKQLADTFAATDGEFIDVRKRLLMQLDRVFRQMVVGGLSAADNAPSLELSKDLAFVLKVLDPDNKVAQSVLDHIACSVRYDESQRKRQYEKLVGPGASVIDSLGKALNEDLLIVKEKLDLFERGSSVEDEDVSLVSEVLMRLSNVLLVLNLPRLSGDCAEKAKVVSSWQGLNGVVDENDLLLVADAIIGVEAAIAKYKESGSGIDHVLVEKDPDNHFLKEAHVMVVEESQSSLALTKRSISAYVDSGGDKLHLTNVAQALDCSRGGMLLMGNERVASIINSCEECIRSELLEAQSLPSEKLLETLADALSSVEYYIEMIGGGTAANDELLKLSEDSLKSIGYEVHA